MLGKKESIWLGIRVIGLYWLYQLIFTFIHVVWIIGYWLWTMMSGDDRGNFAASLLTCLFNVLVPFLLTVYFLFYGTFIYKIVNRFTRSRLDDPARPQGYCYCESVVRFLGVWTVGMLLYRIYMSVMLPLQSMIRYYLMHPQHDESRTFTPFFMGYFKVEMLVSLLLYLGLTFLLGWYFLKKGEFFINLLSRFWLKKVKQDPGPAPAGISTQT